MCAIQNLVSHNTIGNKYTRLQYIPSLCSYPSGVDNMLKKPRLLLPWFCELQAQMHACVRMQLMFPFAHLTFLDVLLSKLLCVLT